MTIFRSALSLDAVLVALVVVPEEAAAELEADVVDEDLLDEPPQAAMKAASETAMALPPAPLPVLDDAGLRRFVLMGARVRHEASWSGVRVHAAYGSRTTSGSARFH